MARVRAGIGFGALLLTLTLLVPGSAAAVSQVYTLDTSSTITPTGGSPQPLTGEMELSFSGFCVVPFDINNCLLHYNFDALDLAGAGESIVLGSITPINDGVPDVFPLRDLAIDYPGAPAIDDFVLERQTLPQQQQMELRYLERLLDSPDPNSAPDAVFGGSALPEEIFFDVDLIEKELRQILGDGGGMFPSTVSTQVIANLSFHAVAVPEPASGVLLALGLGVLGARRSQRRRGSERRGQGAAK